MMTAPVNNYSSQLAQRANEVVNQVFYGTLLREFRESQPPSMFNQGPGATTFIRQLDMELVKRMSRRGDSPLAQALIRQLDCEGWIRPTAENVDRNHHSTQEIQHD